MYRSALSLESWADAPITNVALRDVQIEFDGGGTAEQARQPVKSPGVDARPLPSWGIYARNVEQLALEDIRLSLAQEDARPVVLADRVKELNLDNFSNTRVPGVTQPLVATNVGKVNLRNTDVPGAASR